MGLYAKMSTIMGQVSQIDKDSQMKGGQLNYKFVSDAAVFHKMRGLLVEHSIALFASMTAVEQDRIVVGEDKFGNAKDKFHTRARFEFTLVDSETGESHMSTWYAESEDSVDKGVNKCATAALKNWLLKTFIIPTGDDPDAPNGAELQPPPVHDRTRTMTDEPEDDDPLEAITWTRDVVALDKFIAFARKEWATEGEKPMTFPHLANRLIKALSLDGTAANRAELDALLEAYPGSKQDAAESVRTYDAAKSAS